MTSTTTKVVKGELDYIYSIGIIPDALMGLFIGRRGTHINYLKRRFNFHSVSLDRTSGHIRIRLSDKLSDDSPILTEPRIYISNWLDKHRDKVFSSEDQDGLGLEEQQEQQLEDTEVIVDNVLEKMKMLFNKNNK